jgi:hypothetical protein
MLALLAVTAGPWGLLSGIRGRWIWSPPSDPWVAALTIGIFLVTLGDWGVRLWLDAN